MYDDIVKQVLYYGSTKVSKENNWWYTGSVPRKFNTIDPSMGCDIQGFTLYLYALGDMALDMMGPDGKEGVQIKRFFTYYLGVSHKFSPARRF